MSTADISTPGSDNQIDQSVHSSARTWKMPNLKPSIHIICWCLGIAAILIAASPIFAQQQAFNSDDVRRGHHLAIEFCSICHVAARDQPMLPILRPPARSFEEIAQRDNTSVETLQNYLATTHSGLDNPAGMPNPRLSSFEIRQAAAYILSLRKAR